MKKHIYDSISHFFIILITVFQPNWFSLQAHIFYFIHCKHYSEKWPWASPVWQRDSGSGCKGRKPSSWWMWFPPKAPLLAVHPPSQYSSYGERCHLIQCSWRSPPPAFLESCCGSWFFINELTGFLKNFFLFPGEVQWAGDLSCSLTAEMCKEIRAVELLGLAGFF